jgi:hypothetical protein
MSRPPAARRGRVLPILSGLTGREDGRVLSADYADGRRLESRRQKKNGTILDLIEFSSLLCVSIGAIGG